MRKQELENNLILNIYSRIVRLRQMEIKYKDKQKRRYVTIVNNYNIRYAVRDKNKERRYCACATSTTVYSFSHRPVMGVESSKN